MGWDPEIIKKEKGRKPSEGILSFPLSHLPTTRDSKINHSSLTRLSVTCLDATTRKVSNTDMELILRATNAS